MNTFDRKRLIVSGFRSILLSQIKCLLCDKQAHFASREGKWLWGFCNDHCENTPKGNDLKKKLKEAHNEQGIMEPLLCCNGDCSKLACFGHRHCTQMCSDMCKYH